MPDSPDRHREDVRDRVIWLFAIVAAILIVGSVALLTFLALFRPGADIEALSKSVSTQLSIIVGAVLGYAARGPQSPPDTPPQA